MDQTLKEIIMDQSGHTDPIYVEKVYFECNQDVGETICKLQNLTPAVVPEKSKTQFDEMRAILEEKDKIFRKFLDQKKALKEM